MNIFACYIITKDGRLLVSEYFQDKEEIPNEANLSGVLAAINMLSDDLLKTEGAAEKFTLKGITYHFRSFGEFFVVIVSDLEGTPKKVMDQLGWRFLDNYDLLNWNGKTDEFQPFREEIIEVISKNFNIDTSGRIDPTKRLTPSTVFKLPNRLQEIAMALLRLQHGTLSELKIEVGEEILELEDMLTDLIKMGFVGVNKRSKSEVYFIRQ